MATPRRSALVVAAFPILLATGVLLIPVVPDYSDHVAAAAAAAHTGRWVTGHFVCVAAFGVGAAAAHALGAWLAGAGERRWHPWAVLALCVGSALHAAGLALDGAGPAITTAAGSPATAFFEHGARFVVPLFVAGAICFGLGLIALTGRIRQRRLLPDGQAQVVFAASILFAAAEAIPSGWGLYLVAACALVVFLPIARALATAPAS